MNPYLKKLAKFRNLIFLIMCFGVHFSFTLVFLCLGLKPLMIINVFSTAFYAVLLIQTRTPQQGSLIAAYLEIILFAIICDTLTAGRFGFSTYILGMIASLVFICPEVKKSLLFLQTIGIAAAMYVSVIILLDIRLFPAFIEQANMYSRQFRFFNMLIAVITVCYTSFFYRIRVEEYESKLTYNVYHDSLSGLHNRRYLIGKLNDKSFKHQPFVLAMLDIDHFKNINDTYGHDAGDEVIRELSRTILMYTDENTLSIRWGGEEFLLYFSNKSRKEARWILESIVMDIHKTMVYWNDEVIQFTATIGMSEGENAEDFDQAIQLADSLLYEGKRNGRDCIMPED